MSATLTDAPPDEPLEQRFVLGRVSWDSYLTISDALDDRPGVRTIYCDGRLILVGKSRRHDWYAERLGQLAITVARGLGIPWEDAGGATFRREDSNAGLEGDKTFYLDEHAVQMRGPQDIDLTAQPPPDIAIEVEVSHSADAALVAWARLRRSRGVEVSPRVLGLHILYPVPRRHLLVLGTEHRFSDVDCVGRLEPDAARESSSALTDGSRSSTTGSRA